MDGMQRGEGASGKVQDLRCRQRVHVNSTCRKAYHDSDQTKLKAQTPNKRYRPSHSDVSASVAALASASTCRVCKTLSQDTLNDAETPTQHLSRGRVRLGGRGGGQEQNSMFVFLATALVRTISSLIPCVNCSLRLGPTTRASGDLRRSHKLHGKTPGARQLPACSELLDLLLQLLDALLERLHKLQQVS